MKITRLLTVPAVGLALTAATVTASAAATAEPQAVTNTVSLSAADGGGTFNVASGDVVQVHLGAVRDGSLTWVWTVPTATSTSVLLRTGGGNSTLGDADATFSAIATGASDITAQRRCVPDPGSVCPMIIYTWRATVNVS
ncbi:hypothetical protein ACWCXH_33075 [Kitasatospora sp. NPDC001660]